MPDSQTVFDLASLARWDGDGGAGPYGPRQGAIWHADLSLADVRSNRQGTRPALNRSEPAAQSGKLPSTPRPDLRGGAARGSTRP
jgi:hypothetical protein